MLEAIAILSNGIVIVAIGALYRKVNSQEKALTDHRLLFTETITNRPDFDQVDEKITKAATPLCKKVKTLTDDFKHHRHDKEKGAVILGT